MKNMAALTRNVRAFFKLQGSVLKDVGCRQLYSPAALGVDNYVRSRERVATQFTNLADKFRAKMAEFSEPSSANMIFTEDLKNMAHLVQKGCKEDLELVVKMMTRFYQQNKNLRFGSFIFGPVIMRMFYYVNEPDLALEVFRKPELDGFFDQLVSYQVLMDLLLINHKYKEVLEVFEAVTEKQLQNARYPRNVTLLAFAACYKMQNSEESLNYAMSLWNNLQKVGHQPLRRTCTFAAALALRQNAPQYTLEIVSSVRQQNYVTVRNLKMAALADLGRPDDVMPLLRSILVVDDPDARKQSVMQDALDKVRQSVELADNKELSYQFGQIEKQLREQGHLQSTVTVCCPGTGRAAVLGDRASDGGTAAREEVPGHKLHPATERRAANQDPTWPARATVVL
ncbi:pentatricopeptide repeat-containing protein 2, mitochondrial-like isoform X3 [Bacillus rossius redtenbacheri]|uniref:pentatricopeptide repeat-containing protein 2, mitochondrial-like isoform X3 n=1 Tax=Bacillus rossius redtenbacheri TaxID=93214 RepID=UPI002FDDDF7E